MFAAFLLCAFFLLLLFRFFPITSNGEKETESYRKASVRAKRAISSKSRSFAINALRDLEDSFDRAERFLSYTEKSRYWSVRESLLSHLDELEKEEWIKKADRKIEKIRVCQKELLLKYKDLFENADVVRALVRKTASAWNAYLSIDPLQFQTEINPYRYLRESLGNDYDPAMVSKESYIRKLEEIGQEAADQKKRRIILEKSLLRYISEHPGIQRSVLQKIQISGYSSEEIRSVCKEIAEKGKWTEEKKDGRYVVRAKEKKEAEAS